MTAPNMGELLEQRAQIERQIAELILEPLTAAKTALAATGVQTLLTKMQQAHDALPEGEVKTQISNVMVVLTSVPLFFEAEIARLNGLVTPAEPAPEPET